MITPLTVEQARKLAMDRVCDCEATARFDHSTEVCRDFGCAKIDTLIALVRAEERRVSAAMEQDIQRLHVVQERAEQAEARLAEEQAKRAALRSELVRAEAIISAWVGEDATVPQQIRAVLAGEPT